MHLDGWTIALQAVNFAILVWLLRRFLYKPVLAMVDQRKAEIQRQYDDAKVADETAKAALAAIATERAGIAAEREAALKAASVQAGEVAVARKAQAEQEAAALLDAGRKTLAAERDHALQATRDAALDLGADFARRLLAEVPVQLRAEAWIERIEQYLDAMPKPDLAALAAQLTQGAALKVVSVGPLPPATEEQWRARLRSSLGDVTVAFETDPALIAGAELHFPTAIVSFSWQSVLTRIRSEIGVHDDAR